MKALLLKETKGIKEIFLEANYIWRAYAYILA